MTVRPSDGRINKLIAYGILANHNCGGAGVAVAPLPPRLIAHSKLGLGRPRNFLRIYAPALDPTKS